MDKKNNKVKLPKVYHLEDEKLRKIAEAFECTDGRIAVFFNAKKKSVQIYESFEDWKSIAEDIGGNHIFPIYCQNCIDIDVNRKK